MKMRISNVLPIVLMLILAALTLWLRQAAENPGEAARPGGSGPEAVVEKLSLVRLNTDGSAQYSLSASRMQMFPADEATLLEVPRFEKRDPDGVTTLVTADRGRIIRNGDEAFFYGNVTLSRTAPDSRSLLARTEYLQIIPKQDLARTDRHVTITDGKSILSGTGMEINKQKRQISLQSQVKGTYHAKRQ